MLKHVDKGRNHIKGILTRGQVYLDGHQETRYNARVSPGQIVEILKTAPVKPQISGVEVLYEDNDLIVINKQAGLLTMASKPQDKQQTAYREVMAYVKQSDPKNRIYIVHRLDRDTSGVMLFAKNEETKHLLQDRWKEVVTERTYIALVQGKVKTDRGTIESWLKETKTHLMYVSSSSYQAKKAILHYQVIDATAKYTLLKINLETGRKNQIRVQLSSIGHPVVGDKKYGAKANPIGRLGLHAAVLSFKHPVKHVVMTFEAAPPKSFNLN